jgi:hypothetical protein
MDTMMTVARPLLLAALTVGSALAAAANLDAQCDVRRELERELDAADISGVLVSAEAGSLQVTGTAGTTVRVTGVVCASDEELADQALLVVEPRRGAAWIEADLPDGDGFWRRDYVRMDLTIEMPSALAADIRDGSGETVVTGIAGVRIDDGSGSIEVEDIEGQVEIDDGSGEVRIRRAGAVEIEDGSGGIEIAAIQGDVHVIEDGSGEMDIREVRGSVRIDDDGSGSIFVADVEGDLVVEEDGSGSLRYRDVRGQVRVPPGDRR